jgi:hypothetical protein
MAEANRTVYEETSLAGDVSIEPFIQSLLPLLHVYGVSDRREQTDAYKNDQGGLETSTEIIGNAQGAHLKYYTSGGYSDGYSAYNGSISLSGAQLIHSLTGERLDLDIRFTLYNFSSPEITLRIEGEAGEVERIKEAIKPAFEQCRWR